MKTHKLCKLFPKITGEDFAVLALDIKENGLRQPIVTFEGQILDGQNRYDACISAGIKPQFDDYIGENPLAYVISQNMARRHLTDDQRSIIAADISTAKSGGYRDHSREPRLSLSAKTIEQAARTMKVSPSQVKRAKSISKSSKKLANKVKEGKITLNKAHETIHPPKPKPTPLPNPVLPSVIATADPIAVITKRPDKTTTSELNYTPKALKAILDAYRTALVTAEEKECKEFGILAIAFGEWAMNHKRDRKPFNPYAS